MTAKRTVERTVVAAMLCLLGASASAQGMQRMGPGRNAQGDGPRRMVPADQGSAQAVSRDADPRDDDGRGRGNSLSPEERRQLRRDVHQAGRDLYPDRMPPRRGFRP